MRRVLAGMERRDLRGRAPAKRWFCNAVFGGAFELRNTPGTLLLIGHVQMADGR